MRAYMCRDVKLGGCIVEVKNIDDALRYMNEITVDAPGLYIYNDEGKGSHIAKEDIGGLITFLMVWKEKMKGEGDGDHVRKLIRWWLKYHSRFEEVDEL